MAVDQMSAVLNQKLLGPIFESINLLDEKLKKHNIHFNNTVIKSQIRIMIGITFISEIIIGLSVCLLLVDYSKPYAFLWVILCVPTLYNSLDKIWFATIMYCLKQRFEGINSCLDELVHSHKKTKKLQLSKGKQQPTHSTLSYLRSEIINNINNEKKFWEKEQWNKVTPINNKSKLIKLNRKSKSYDTDTDTNLFSMLTN